jgi:hypothetical protein
MNQPAPQRSRHHAHRHHGKWILTDADLHHLWAIGPNLYPGHAVSGALDTIGRRGLLPALRAAVDTRRPVDRTIHLLGAAWRVRAIPLLGVVSHTPIGVLGIYDSPTAPQSSRGREIPPTPVMSMAQIVMWPKVATFLESDITDHHRPPQSHSSDHAAPVGPV